MNKITTAVVILVALLAGLWLWFGYANGAMQLPWGNNGGVACTEEAKICPDGSAVGRTGPNCEFAACPSTAGMATIQGVVTTSPTCPVEKTPPDPACAPQGYRTIVSVTGGGQLHSIPTDKNGFYSISVTPDTYTVTASGGDPLPSCKPEDVTAVADKIVTLNLSCDTGIR